MPPHEYMRGDWDGKGQISWPAQSPDNWQQVWSRWSPPTCSAVEWTTGKPQAPPGYVLRTLVGCIERHGFPFLAWSATALLVYLVGHCTAGVPCTLFLQPGLLHCTWLPACGNTVHCTVYTTWLWEPPDGGSVSLGATGTNLLSFVFSALLVSVQFIISL